MGETITDTPARPLLWTKRMGALFVLVALLVLATRLAWGWHASSRLAEMDRRVVALGGKGRLEDYTSDGRLPPDRNAAEFVRSAAALIDEAVPSPSASNAEFDSRRVPPEPLWFDFAEKAFAANEQAIRMLQKGLADRPDADWGTRYQSGSLNFFSRHLNRMRALANEGADAGLLLHFKGNDAEAFELFEALLDLGQVVRAEPSLVSHLVGIGIDSLTFARILTAAPAARVATSAGDATGVPRDRVERLIARLLADASAQHAFERAMLFEMRATHANKSVLAWSGWFVEPLADTATVDHLREIESVIERSRSGKWPTEEERRARWRAERLLGTASDPDEADLFPKGWWMADLGTYETMLSTEGKHRIERGFVAISLAVMLYRHDHAGAFPEALEALVPRYLARVPTDLQSPDGRPIGYRVEKTPDGAPRPMIFSLAGSPAPRPPPYLNYDYHALDGTDRPMSQQDNLGQWRDLSRWADATPNWKTWQDPTTQPGLFGTFGDFGDFAPPDDPPPSPTTEPAP